MRPSRTIGALVIVMGLLGHPEETAAGADRAPWAVHLRTLDDALARRDIVAAVRAWGEAHRTAAASRQWEGMVEVGDAYLRIGGAPGEHPVAAARAREAYRTALARARRQGSLDGVLRTAEAFAALGDRDTVTECLRVASVIAAQDPEAQADVRTVAARLGERARPEGGVRPSREGSLYPSTPADRGRVEEIRFTGARR